MSDKNTDKQKILEYLKQGNVITFNDCQRIFGSNSLRERIKDLRRLGYKIKTRKEQNLDTLRWHAVYFLEDNEPPRTEHEQAVADNFHAQEEKMNRQPFEKNGQFAFLPI